MQENSTTAGQPAAPPGPATRSAGLERLLAGGGLPVDRLPVLRAAFERAAADCATPLQKAINGPVSLSLAAVVAGRADAVLERHAGNAMFAVFDAPGWNTRIVAGLSRSFVFSATEALLGGDGRELPLDDERPFSNIETHLATWCLERLSDALQGALSTIAPIELSLDHSAVRLDPATLGKGAAVVVATIALQVLGRGGVLFVIVPQAALIPFRQVLASDPSKQATPGDTVWTSRLGSQIGQAAVRVSALLESRDLTLGDVADLKVGQVLTLGPVGGSPILLACNNRSLFRCQLGQSEGHYTVRVDAATDEARAVIEGLAA